MKLRSLLFALTGAFLVHSVSAETAATPASPTAKWEPEISAFEKKDKEAPPEKGAVLFVGSSSIRMWTSVAQDFPDYRVINRGFGGSMVADSTAFIDRIVVPYAPRMIVFYAGTNDLAGGRSPETVAADFRAFAQAVHAKLPTTEIDFISIAPNPKRWEQVEKQKAANAMVREYCNETPHLKFIDVFPHMLGPDGHPKEGIYREDGLHMNPEGYKIWVKIVRPYLPAPDLEASAAKG